MKVLKFDTNVQNLTVAVGRRLFVLVLPTLNFMFSKVLKFDTKAQNLMSVVGRKCLSEFYQPKILKVLKFDTDVQNLMGAVGMRFFVRVLSNFNFMFFKFLP